MAWAAVISRVHRGVAVAIDYDHELADRPGRGSLTAYRRGRTVAVVPDGSCDVTAHVALDACSAAGVEAGATSSVLLRQADALRALGVRSVRPDVAVARDDPSGYLRALADAGSAAELLDRTGLGGFGWLVQAVGVSLPERLARIG
jgi:SAM-dependent MidA family methyltransferase